MENLDCKINVFNIQKYKKCNIQEKKDDGESLHDLVKHEIQKHQMLFTSVCLDV